MYAVICSPIFYKEIEQVITSREEIIVEKAIDYKNDVVNVFERISRIAAVKHLIIDVSSIEDENKLVYAIRRYRSKNDKNAKTQIIIIAPNLEPPNEIMNSIVKLGIYDIICPKAENLEDIILGQSLVEVLESPSSYKKASKWDIIDESNSNNNGRKEKVRIKKVFIEKEVEKPVIIEKKIREEVKVEIISNSNIVVLSNAPTGKSWITWNLAHCLSTRGYKTSVLNIDNGYSANSFFGIEGQCALKGINDEKEINTLEEKAYHLNSNLSVYTNEILSKEEINNETFTKVLNELQRNSDIVLIDCKSEINEVMKTAITYSNIVLFIFDMDNMHFNFNKQMIDSLENLNFKKTIAVINNAFLESTELENIKHFIEKLNKNFKGTTVVRNGGTETYDLMHSDSCPYFTKNENLKKDINILMEIMQTSTLDQNKKENIISKISKLLFKK